MRIAERPPSFVFLVGGGAALSLAAAGCPTVIAQGSGGSGGGGTTTSATGAVAGSITGGGGLGEPGCPADQPGWSGTPCSAEGLQCGYGQECCNNECYPSVSCDCAGGTWSCGETDACFGAGGCDPGLGSVDDDGDGYSELEGDCDDCDAQVNPGAAEIIAQQDPNNPGIPTPKDDDCDGLIDMNDPDLQPCDGALSLDSADPMDAVKAIGFCDTGPNGPKFITKASWVLADGSPPGPAVDMAKFHLGHGLLDHFGTLDEPQEGSRMLALSSGTARNQEEPGFVSRNFDKGYGSPPPQAFEGQTSTCPGVGVSTSSVQDAAGLELEIHAPSNANSLEISFNYRTYDFPQYICTPFMDFFWIDFAQGGPHKNVAFDADGNAVTAIPSFLSQCDCPPAGPGACPMPPPSQSVFDCTGTGLLEGTDFFGNTNPKPTYDGWTNGGSGWFVTTVPVTPNQDLSLRFVVFDSGVTAAGIGDHNLDSLVTVDRFKWHELSHPNETVHQ